MTGMGGTIDRDVERVFGVVHDVRRRWRLARVLRGVAIVTVSVLALLFVSAITLDALKYDTTAVVFARIIDTMTIIALIWWFVVRPMLPRPADETVALYVEEHAPSLEGSLVSAVEVSRATAVPKTIGERIRRMALERTVAIRGGRDVDQRGLQFAFVALGVTAALVVGLLAFAPENLRHGMGALLVPWGDAEAANPYRVEVDPGNATVARGATVLVRARAFGFQPDGAELMARTSDTSAWIHVPMTADSSRQFTARLLDVGKPTDYVVETNGLRSRVYRLDVADLPYTKRIDLEYHFPAYTALPTQRVDSAGDIAAVTGTQVRVRVTPTRATSGGRIVIEGGDTLKLKAESDGSLVATLPVKRSGFYRVELEGARGDLLTASLDYAVDALPDRPPSVHFNKPGRDTKVLAVDEVYTEARADDDYGVAKLDLMYSVNGAPEKTAPLHSTLRAIREISAGHTFMLEDYALQPGDVVSYYARATDNDAVSGAKSVTSDIYFLQVRPYSQEYRQQQGGGGGGGGGQQPSQLSERQRQIIAGTFNSNRDSSITLKKTLEEDVATLRLSQQKLREDVDQLAQRLVQRGIAANDSNYAKIAKILPVASAAMDTAEQALAATRLKDALQPEQRALQQLQRAEAMYREIQVSMGQQGGGGGGGGQSQAEDLADLFELRSERMRNQYEEVQRGADAQQNANQQVDATAERLKQLAARQQQENERARRKADSLATRGATGTGSGDSQRQLAQEAEQAARQLERLAREQQSQELADAARRLNDAADAMRRSAANSGRSGGAEAQAALDRLKEASRLLDRERGSRVQRSVDDAASAARRLAEEESSVRSEVSRQPGATGQERENLQRSIEQRKNAMADSAKALASRLERMGLEARKEAPDVARELAEAADTLRQRRVEDKLRITASRVRDLPQEYQDANERIIAADIDKLNSVVEEARTAARNGRSADRNRKNEQALDRARDLVRGMESLDERRQQQRSQQGQQGQGREGQQGQQGQSGQQGNGGGGAREGGNRTLGMGAPGGGGGQYVRELRERINDARALRRELAGRDSVDLSQLDRAISRMESLTRYGDTKSDPRAEGDLRKQVVEGLRSFEFQLDKLVNGRGNERVLVDRSGEVPPEYRKAVEEYYRSLGRTKPPR